MFNVSTSEKTQDIPNLLTWILMGISIACGFVLSLTVDTLGHENHLLPRP